MTERILTRRELNRALLARQLLLDRRPAPAPKVVERLGGLQAQHSSSPYLSLHARIDGFERSELTTALERRRVVRARLQRGTLHIVAPRDYWAFTAGRQRSDARRDRSRSSMSTLGTWGTTGRASTRLPMRAARQPAIRRSLASTSFVAISARSARRRRTTSPSGRAAADRRLTDTLARCRCARSATAGQTLYDCHARRYPTRRHRSPRGAALRHLVLSHANARACSATCRSTDRHEQRTRARDDPRGRLRRGDVEPRQGPRAPRPVRAPVRATVKALEDEAERTRRSSRTMRPARRPRASTGVAR